MNDSIEEQPIEVKALENFLLYIKFKNKDMYLQIVLIKRSHCLNKSASEIDEIIKNYYKNLRNKENFKKVKVFGITLKWSTGEDIAPEKIYFNSIPLASFNYEIKEMN